MELSIQFIKAILTEDKNQIPTIGAFYNEVQSILIMYLILDSKILGNNPFLLI